MNHWIGIEEVMKEGKRMKTFHIGDVLSIYTQRLCLPNGMDGIFEILNYMTSDNLYLHQLPRASTEAAPYLLEQFPWLREVNADDLKTPETATGEERNALNYAAVMQYAAKYGEYHKVRPMHSEDHENINPLEEAKRMAPHAHIEAYAIDDEPSVYGDIPPKAEW